MGWVESAFEEIMLVDYFPGLIGNCEKVKKIYGI